MGKTQDKRSEPRFKVEEGSVLIDGKGYPLDNWSDGGFSLLSYDGEQKPGDEVDIVYSLYLGQSTLQLRGRAIIVWTDAERRRMGGHVLSIDERSRVLLREKLARPDA